MVMILLQLVINNQKGLGIHLFTQESGILSPAWLFLSQIFHQQFFFQALIFTLEILPSV